MTPAAYSEIAAYRSPMLIYDGSCGLCSRSVQSMLWVEGGQVFAKSGALIKAATYLGGWWSRLAVLGSFCPSFILNRVYEFIAENRGQLSSKPAVCSAPSPEQRNRFLA